MTIILNKSHISLSNRKREQLVADVPVSWSSNNPNIQVDATGSILAMNDYLRPDGQAIITATDSQNNQANCEVTVVDWIANETELNITQLYADFYYPTKLIDGTILAVKGVELFQSTDGMVTLNKICNLPEAAAYQPILITPFGYFYRSNVVGEPDKIYRSTDLVNWTLSFTGNLRYLTNAHQFCSYYDEITETAYVYMSEYTGAPGNVANRHKVYRGTITATTETWDTILEFYSTNEYNSNSALYGFFASHVHLVMVDPYTGHVWVGIGDLDAACRLLYSTNHGNTFSTLGMGSQDWRSLSVWFTENYIYWNMDTHLSQSIWRIPRSVFNGTYPVITSDVDDYRERVAVLDQGSLWYVCKVTDNQGDDVFLVGGAAEGQIRDWRARVFALKEMPEGKPQVQELISLPSNDPSQYLWGARIEPLMQDNEGNVYLRGYSTNPAGLLKGTMSSWSDKYMSPAYSWLQHGDLEFIL